MFVCFFLMALGESGGFPKLESTSTPILFNKLVNKSGGIPGPPRVHVWCGAA